MQAWVISETAKLYVDWTPNQENFTMNISAHNPS